MKGNDKMPVYHFSCVLRRPGGTNIAFLFCHLQPLGPDIGFAKDIF